MEIESAGEAVLNHLAWLGESRDDIPDFKVRAVALYGSRIKGTHRPDSDLDVLIEYSGDAREDDLFNALNREPLYIDDTKVDFNPIKKSKSGTIAELAPYAVRLSL